MPTDANPIRSALRWPLLLPAILLALSPAIVPLLLILNFGYNAHFQDEWDPHIGGLQILLHDHALKFSDLYRQHNEHRIVVPRLIYLALDSMSHWNAMWSLIAEWCIVLATSLGILRLTAVTLSQDKRITPPVLLIWFVCNLLIFTPAAWENWLWGIGVVNVLPMAFITAALVAVTSNLREAPKITLAIFCALGASYSSGDGLLIWPLVGATIAWPWSVRDWLARKWSLLAWALAGALVIGTYFIGYVKPDHHGAHPYDSTWPSVLQYFLVFLGLPFARVGHYSQLQTATFFAIVELLLLLAAAWYFLARWFGRDHLDDARERIVCRKLLPWLLIAGFAILSGAIAAYCRAGMGIDQAIQASRYITFALYLPLSLVQLASIIGQDVRDHHSLHFPLARVSTVLSTAVVILVVLSWADAFANARMQRIVRHEAKAAALFIDVIPDNPLTTLLFLDRASLKTEIHRFAEIGALTPPPINSANAREIQVTDPDLIHNAKGFIERAGVAAGDSIYATGWAAFMSRSEPADAVILTYTVEGSAPTIFAMALLGSPRPDLAAASRIPGLELSGWNVQFPRSRLPNNGHNLKLDAWAFDTDTGRAFKLENSCTLP